MANGEDRACRRNRGWHRAQWRAHVEAWAASGLSGAAYCRGRGLPVQSLYRWRRVFAQADGARDDAAGAAVPVFAEVDVAAFASARSAGGVEVALAGDRVVRVHPGFDAATLAAVVRVLEGLGC